MENIHFSFSCCKDNLKIITVTRVNIIFAREIFHPPYIRTGEETVSKSWATPYNFPEFRSRRQSYLRCRTQERDYKKFSTPVGPVNGERSRRMETLCLRVFHASRTKLTGSGKLVDTFDTLSRERRR